MAALPLPMYVVLKRRKKHFFLLLLCLVERLRACFLYIGRKHQIIKLAIFLSVAFCLFLANFALPDLANLIENNRIIISFASFAMFTFQSSFWEPLQLSATVIRSIVINLTYFLLTRASILIISNNILIKSNKLS